MASPIEAIQHLSKSVSGSTHLADLLPVLQCLDHLLQRATAAAELAYGSPFSADPYRGLYINQDEVSRLFSQEPGAPRLNPATDPTEKGLAEELHEKLRTNPLMTRLADSFGLAVFDLDLILLALAPEVDLRYERLFAYLQDDVTRRRPTIDLALNLFCTSADEKIARRSHFAAESPLVQHDLLQLMPDPSQNGPPLLAHYLKLDEQVTNFLLGHPIIDSRLSSFCQIREPEPSGGSLALSMEVKRALTSLALQARDSNQPLRFYFSGPCGADKITAAEAISREANLPLLVVDLNHALTTEMDVRRTVRRVFRQSWFQDAIVYFDGCDALHGDGRTLHARLLTASLLEHSGIVVLAGEQSHAAVQTGDSNQSLGLIEIPFSIPKFPLRRECWQASLQASNVVIDDQELEVLASRFRLTPSQVSQAVVQACNKSLWLAATGPMTANTSTPQPTLSDFCSAARAQSQHQLGSLARKIEPVYRWSDIVLPKEILDQLRELCSRVAERRRVLGEWGFGRKLSLGKGVSALFAGPSGTGKTMAAEIVANELELELYKIDLSGIVSKYIGETEKNLDRIFTTAETANAILFFDEADALFGKRSEVRDSHDRYANIEISYLLQKMEQYEGIAILATNLRQNLDDAFLRRLQIVVEFPFPDEQLRRQIWEQLFPPETPRTEDINFDLLAQQFRLAGGNIKNIVLGSAFLAAANGGRVEMKHLLQSAQREYQKLGRALS
jgi:AAA+ superfamily predicted ATPase